MLISDIESHFMHKALQEADIALAEGEVPVGAVVTCQGRLIAKAHNQCERLQDSSAHAEMLAMTAAAAYLGNKYLTECSIYVSLEPCAMCAAAMRWAQLQCLCYAASDPQQGFSQWKRPLLHPRTTITTGIHKAKAEALLHTFFRALRSKHAPS